MTSTNEGTRLGGYRRQVDRQKLGPTLLIASRPVLRIRTAQWDPTHSEELSHVEWDSQVGHSVRVAKMVLPHLTVRCPELFQARDVPRYVATDDEVPR